MAYYFTQNPTPSILNENLALDGLYVEQVSSRITLNPKKKTTLHNVGNRFRERGRILIIAFLSPFNCLGLQYPKQWTTYQSLIATPMCWIVTEMNPVI